jgi:hypothetical protein
MSSKRLARLDRQIELNGFAEFFRHTLQGLESEFGARIMPVASKNYNTINRYIIQYQGTWSVAPTSEQSSNVSGENKVRRCIEFSGTPSSSDGKLLMAQRIASENSFEVGGENVNVHRWVYSESATVARLRILRANAEDDHSAQTEIFNETVALTVGIYQEVKWLGVPISSLAGNNGYEVELTLENMSVTGSTVIHRIEAMRHYISFNGNIVNEFSSFAGSVLDERDVCSYYFEALEYGTSGAISVGTIQSSGSIWGILNFKEKRKIPAVTSTFQTSNGWRFFCKNVATNLTVNAAFDTTTRHNCRLRANFTHGAGGNGESGMFEALTGGNGRIFINAEL